MSDYHNYAGGKKYYLADEVQDWLNHINNSDLEKRQKEYGLEKTKKVHLLTERVTEKLPDAIKETNALVGFIMKTNKEFYLGLMKNG